MFVDKKPRFLVFFRFFCPVFPHFPKRCPFIHIKCIYKNKLYTAKKAKLSTVFSLFFIYNPLNR